MHIKIFQSFRKNKREIVDQSPHEVELVFPYQSISPLLETLTEEEVSKVEIYVDNLRKRKMIKPTQPQMNQRTKKKVEVLNKKGRSLDDEIQSAKDKLLKERLANSGRR